MWIGSIYFYLSLWFKLICNYSSSWYWIVSLLLPFKTKLFQWFLKLFICNKFLWIRMTWIMSKTIHIFNIILNHYIYNYILCIDFLSGGIILLYENYNLFDKKIKEAFIWSHNWMYPPSSCINTRFIYKD